MDVTVVIRRKPLAKAVILTFFDRCNSKEATDESLGFIEFGLFQFRVERTTYLLICIYIYTNACMYACHPRVRLRLQRGHPATSATPLGRLFHFPGGPPAGIVTAPVGSTALPSLGAAPCLPASPVRPPRTTAGSLRRRRMHRRPRRAREKRRPSPGRTLQSATPSFASDSQNTHQRSLAKQRGPIQVETNCRRPSTPRRYT